MADNLSPLAAALRAAYEALPPGRPVAEVYEELATACVMWWSREPVPPRVAKPATPTERPTCATCVYWERKDDHTGSCRPHAPRRATDREPDDWATTADDEWCGEHDKFPAWIAARAEGGR